MRIVSYRIGIVLPKESHDIMTKVKQCLRYINIKSSEFPVNDEKSVYSLKLWGGDDGFGYLYCCSQLQLKLRRPPESWPKARAAYDNKITELQSKKVPERIRDSANYYIYLLKLILSVSCLTKIGIVVFWDGSESDGRVLLSSMPNETIKLADFTIEFILMCKPELIYYVEKDETVCFTIW